MLTTIIGLGVAGMLLLFLEMFLPGLIAGIAGAVLLIIAVVMAYTEIGPEAGNLALLIATLGSAALWWWWSTQFQHTRFGRMMTLETSASGTTGAAGLSELPGQSGTAVTPLRPGGTVIVQGRRVDAVTDGEFIDPGTPIVVVRAHGLGVVVRATHAENKPAEA